MPIGSTLRFGAVCCDSCSSTDGARTPVHARALRLASASGQRFVRAFHAANCDIRNPQTQKLSSHTPPLCAGSPKRASNGECTHVRRLRKAGIQHPQLVTQPCRTYALSFNRVSVAFILSPFLPFSLPHFPPTNTALAPSPIATPSSQSPPPHHADQGIKASDSLPPCRRRHCADIRPPLAVFALWTHQLPSRQSCSA